MINTEDYLCLSCNSFGKEKYCSKCSSPLSIDQCILPELLIARLVCTGFEVFKEEDRSKNNLEEITLDFLNQIKKLLGIVLVRFDMQGHTSFMTVIGLLKVEQKKSNYWDELFFDIARKIPSEILYINGRKVKVLEIKIYQISNNTDINNVRKFNVVKAQPLGSRFSTIFRSGTLWSLQGIEVYPLNSVVGGNNFIDIDRSQITAALKQLSSNQENRQETNKLVFFDIFHVFYEKTLKVGYNFIVNWSLLSVRPFSTGVRLRDGNMSGREAFMFLLNAYCFGVLLLGIVGYNPSIPFTDYTLINQVLNFSFIFAQVVFMAIILHPWFKLFKGTGSWRDTLLGQTLAIGIFLPFMFIFEALFIVFFGLDLFNETNIFSIGSMFFSVPVLSAMHQMSPVRTGIVIFSSTAVIIIIITLIIPFSLL